MVKNAKTLLGWGSVGLLIGAICPLIPGLKDENTTWMHSLVSSVFICEIVAVDSILRLRIKTDRRIAFWYYLGWIVCLVGCLLLEFVPQVRNLFFWLRGRPPIHIEHPILGWSIVGFLGLALIFMGTKLFRNIRMPKKV